MLEKIKALWHRIRVFVLLAIASIVFAVMIFKKSVGGGLGEYLKEEAEAKETARKKQEEEMQRLKKEKEEAVKVVEEQRQKELKETEEKAKDKTKKLNELEKKDPDGFKQHLEKELGAKEKRKVRSKKNV